MRIFCLVFNKRADEGTDQRHGPNGRSKGEVDTIAGKSASDIYGDMRELQRDPEVDIMHGQARIYTDAELRAIANYLATIRYENRPWTSNAEICCGSPVWVEQPRLPGKDEEDLVFAVLVRKWGTGPHPSGKRSGCSQAGLHRCCR